MKWQNQVAVVTGGARGIGRATAHLLAVHGAAVAVNYAAHNEAADAVVSEIKAAGGSAIAIQADASDATAVGGWLRRYSRNSVHRRSSSTTPASPPRRRSTPMTPLNSRACAPLCDGTRAAEYHRQRGGAPGFVRTDMTQRGRGAGNWDAVANDFAARAMMDRIGEPEDIANAVAFLAAPESGWITAQVLTVDGGRTDYTGHA